MSRLPISPEINPVFYSSEASGPAVSSHQEQLVPYLFDQRNPQEWQLFNYLFNQSNQEQTMPVIETFTPANFYKLLNTTLHVEDDEAALTAINRFVELSNAEYIEDNQEVAEQSNLLQSIELEISMFIENNQKFHRLNVLGLREAEALSQIYNEHNLLAFAVDTAHRQPAGINLELLEVIYRYRTIIKRINEVFDQSELSEQLTSKMSTREVGWAGDVHDYGHTANRINCRDYLAFSADVDEELVSLNLHNVELKVVTRRRFDE